VDRLHFPHGNIKPSLSEAGGLGGACLKRECRETSLPGFGDTPNLNIPQDWGIEGIEKTLLR